MEAVQEKRLNELHYSGYFTFSKNDAVEIRNLWLKTLSDTQKRIVDSPSEELFGICLDVFEF